MRVVVWRRNEQYEIYDIDGEDARISGGNFAPDEVGMRLPTEDLGSLTTGCEELE